MQCLHCAAVCIASLSEEGPPGGVGSLGLSVISSLRLLSVQGMGLDLLSPTFCRQGSEGLHSPVSASRLLSVQGMPDKRSNSARAAYETALNQPQNCSRAAMFGRTGSERSGRPGGPYWTAVVYQSLFAASIAQARSGRSSGRISSKAVPVPGSSLKPHDCHGS